jgi:DNA-binding transcriptional regulator GbsR (MarR family)
LNNLQKKERKSLKYSVSILSLYIKISPLAGRILGLLIVDGCKSGLSFENIVEKLAASKSSISTNINLFKMEKVYYFTITGDRKIL